MLVYVLGKCKDEMIYRGGCLLSDFKINDLFFVEGVVFVVFSSLSYGDGNSFLRLERGDRVVIIEFDRDISIYKLLEGVSMVFLFRLEFVVEVLVIDKMIRLNRSDYIEGMEER